MTGIVYCVSCNAANGYDPRDFKPSELSCGKCGAFLPDRPVRGVIVARDVLAVTVRRKPTKTSATPPPTLF